MFTRTAIHVRSNKSWSLWANYKESSSWSTSGTPFEMFGWSDWSCCLLSITGPRVISSPFKRPKTWWCRCWIGIPWVLFETMGLMKSRPTQMKIHWKGKTYYLINNSWWNMQKQIALSCIVAWISEYLRVSWSRFWPWIPLRRTSWSATGAMLQPASSWDLPNPQIYDMMKCIEVFTWKWSSPVTHNAICSIFMSDTFRYIKIYSDTLPIFIWRCLFCGPCHRPTGHQKVVMDPIAHSKLEVWSTSACAGQDTPAALLVALPATAAA